MSIARHPNLVGFHGTFESKDDVILAMELLRGQELFEAIYQEGSLNESRAAAVFRDVVSALEFLHSIHVAHRDVKPENIVFADVSNTIAKLTDLGFATMTEVPEAEGGARRTGPHVQRMFSTCGTPNYMAPEVIVTAMNRKVGYSLACDMWSMGVVLYTLLCGYEPFNSEEVFKSILDADYTFDEDWCNISTEAKDLVNALLTVSPKQRLTPTQALRHPWLVGADRIERRQSCVRQPAFREGYKLRLHTYVTKMKVRRAAKSLNVAIDLGVASDVPPGRHPALPQAQSCVVLKSEANKATERQREWERQRNQTMRASSEESDQPCEAALQGEAALEAKLPEMPWMSPLLTDKSRQPSSEAWACPDMSKSISFDPAADTANMGVVSDPWAADTFPGLTSAALSQIADEVEAGPELEPPRRMS